MSSTPSPGLGARANRIPRRNSDHILDLLDRLFRVGRRQVDLVQHGNHVHALLDRGVTVGHGLRFDTLRGIHHQQRTLARGERAGHFVGKIDVPRRIDQVEMVDLAVPRAVPQRRGLSLDRDAALALKVHGIEHLLGHLAVRQAAATLDEPVGQGRLAVVDMRDDREIADVLHADSFDQERQAPATVPRLNAKYDNMKKGCAGAPFFLQRTEF
jgi:hypothetical protein